jgi:hypothetical protein
VPVSCEHGNESLGSIKCGLCSIELVPCSMFGQHPYRSVLLLVSSEQPVSHLSFLTSLFRFMLEISN